MKELRIELPYYAERDSDLDTILHLANKYDLEYDASKLPYMTVFDGDSDNVLLKAEGKVRCYIFGDEDNIEKFLKEISEWFERF